MITGYRDHGHMLACGMESSGVMAELLGRETATLRARVGLCICFQKKKSFWWSWHCRRTGIFRNWFSFGQQISRRYRGYRGLFRRWCSHQGQVYESFNMASLWGLPVVYVIENNQYAMGTSVERHASAETELYKRSLGFKIPSRQVDGMDVLKVRDAAQDAINHARLGNGPFLLEMLTYRYRGHSMSDPAKYRPKDELHEVRTTNDPINNLKKLLLKITFSLKNQLKELDKSIKVKLPLLLPSVNKVQSQQKVSYGLM